MNHLRSARRETSQEGGGGGGGERLRLIIGCLLDVWMQRDDPLKGGSMGNWKQAETGSRVRRDSLGAIPVGEGGKGATWGVREEIRIGKISRQAFPLHILQKSGQKMLTEKLGGERSLSDEGEGGTEVELLKAWLWANFLNE